jgi:hypothetical protein
LAQWVASGFVAIIIATAAAIGIAIVRRPRTPGTPGTAGARRGRSDRGYSPSDRGYSPSDPEPSPAAGRPTRPRRPEGARPPAVPRRPDRDLDYPARPGSRGARDVGRYEPRNPGPRDADPWEQERWYRTDSRLTAS